MTHYFIYQTLTHMKLKLYTLTTLFSLVASLCLAQYQSASSGPWEEPSTWTCNCIPDPTFNIIINENHVVTVGGGLTVSGNLFILPNATLNMAGDGLNFQGESLSNAGMLQGTLRFNGSVQQDWFGNGSAASTVAVIIDNGNDVALLGTQRVTSVDFIDGKFQITQFDLTVTNGITGNDKDHYFVTNGTGFLRRNGVGTAGKLFPIGTTNQYNPVRVAHTTGSTFYKARVDFLVDNPTLDPDAASTDKLKKIWFIERTASITVPADITLGWQTADEDITFDKNICAVAHNDAGAWNVNPPFSAFSPFNGTSNTIHSQFRSGLTSFSPFTVVGGTSALPVELLNFKGNEKGLENVFRWSTASEKNSERHVLTRFDDESKRWVDVASVAGNGTTTEARNYTAADKNPPARGYYRLRFEDIDRTVRYSKTIVVKRKAEVTGDIAAYPNPFESLVNFDYKVPKIATQASIVVINTFGQVILEQSLDVNSDQISFDWSEFAPGAYYVKLKTDTESTEIQRLIKM